MSVSIFSRNDVTAIAPHRLFESMPRAHQRRRILSGRFAARANPMVDIMQGLPPAAYASLSRGHGGSVPEDTQ